MVRPHTLARERSGRMSDPRDPDGGAPVRVRRDIWGLEEEQAWHPVTRAYARAVGQLQKRAATDPTGWTYQAQIHGMPGFRQPDDFRGQCQHNSWSFLPWHRLYLYWFERIVRSCVEADPEVDDETTRAWALPYWNYSVGGTRSSLPEAFREPTMRDGSGPNPLFVAQRNQFINDGEELDPRAIRLREALAPLTFAVPRPDGGFGGAATGWNHRNQDVNFAAGSLEQTPHGDVHMEVGGLMSQFSTAAFDPVFWLHHANIDRVWESWRHELGRPDPDATSSWGTTGFGFHDEQGAEVTGTAADVLDIAAQLQYRYEDISVPAFDRRGRRGRVEEPVPADTPAELIGATEEPLRLSGSSQDVTFPVGRPTGPADRRGGAPAQLILAVEGIEQIESGDPPDVTYAVYVNMPEDLPGDADPEDYYAGNVNFFGIAEPAPGDSDTEAHALRRSFDITDLVEGLRAGGRWDPDAFTVSFRPLVRGRARRGPGGEERTTTPVRVGRIGLYVR
jgi:tyrosinase